MILIPEKLILYFQQLNPNETEGKWPMTMLYPLYYEFAQTAPFSRVAGIRQEATWTKGN